MKGILKNTSKTIQIIQLLSLVFFMLVLAVLLTQLLTNGNMNDVKTMKQMQLLQSVFVFILPPFILAYFWSEKPLNYLHLQTKSDVNSYILVAAIFLVSIPFINLLAYLNQQISLPSGFETIEVWMRNAENEMELLTIKMLNVSTVTDLIFNLFLIAAIAGLGEELFFRGIIQRLFTHPKFPVLAIWITAFLFSAIHMQFYGFFPRLLMGALLGYMLYWSNNLWLPVLAHTINNGVAVVFYYLKFNGYNVLNIDTIGTEKTLWVGILSGILSAFLIAVAYKKLRITKSSDNLVET